MTKRLPAAPKHGEKTPVHFRCSDRQVTFFSAMAKRTQSPFAECIRRGLDSFIDAEEAKKPVERIVVLDRETGSLRTAR